MSGFRPVGSARPNNTYIDGDYDILESDDYIISDGGNTITLPLFASAYKSIEIKNEGTADDIIDGNGSTVPNSTALTPTESRIFIPGASGWVEL